MDTRDSMNKWRRRLTTASVQQTAHAYSSDRRHRAVFSLCVLRAPGSSECGIWWQPGFFVCLFRAARRVDEEGRERGGCWRSIKLAAKERSWSWCGCSCNERSLLQRRRKARRLYHLFPSLWDSSSWINTLQLLQPFGNKQSCWQKKKTSGNSKDIWALFRFKCYLPAYGAAVIELVKFNY